MTSVAESVTESVAESVGVGWSRPGVPHRGWTCVDVEDLGEPDEVCEMCQTAEIRYVHIMQHPDWEGELRVGCVCAGRMEEDYKRAEAREAELKRVVRRMERERERGYERDYAWKRMLAQAAEQERERSPEEREVWRGWIEAANEILERAERLGSRELKFVQDMHYRAVTRQPFTSKQEQWFKAIYLRVVGRKNGEETGK
jgi:hypothetical protein